MPMANGMTTGAPVHYQDCSGNRSQSDSGASVAVGWRNDVWSWDIGTTPMGFNVVDVVGGISYSDDIGPLGYTVNAHRRPISSSLLAFGGQKDSPREQYREKMGRRACRRRGAKSELR